MTLVVDAPTVAAALTEPGGSGTWALELLTSGALAAPHPLPVEVASVLRRKSARGAHPATAAG